MINVISYFVKSSRFFFLLSSFQNNIFVYNTSKWNKLISECLSLLYRIIITNYDDFRGESYLDIDEEINNSSPRIPLDFSRSVY